jgi:hypothetical protein
MSNIRIAATQILNLSCAQWARVESKLLMNALANSFSAAC